MPITVFQETRENIKTVSRNKMELSYIVYHPKWNAALQSQPFSAVILLSKYHGVVWNGEVVFGGKNFS